MSRHIRQRALSMAHVAVACVWHACVLDWLEPESIAWRRAVVRRGPQAIDRRFDGASYLSVAKDIRHGLWRVTGRVDVIISAVQYNS
ncbi:hypothetical protein BCO9919_01541 [Burkholderia cenocepacia]|uniref:Uncharacterized protein n=1 Tax=Burkholderia cenocepacia TaxID=95486 RepID=A0A6J5IZW8_9BURK|nr:hypothetical protein BCO9919_01541 [Burkholderia cenocepacia]